jgi:hypothetical protein
LQPPASNRDNTLKRAKSCSPFRPPTRNTHGHRDC